MDREDIIRMAREAGLAYGSDEKPLGSVTRFAALVAAAEQQKMMERIRHIIVQSEERGAAAERERICKAIKEEDDYCVTKGDYMLDSNDCIAVAKSKWVRPDYSAGAIRARGNT